MPGAGWNFRAPAASFDIQSTPATMPPRYYATPATMPLLVGPDKFPYKTEQKPRYYATLTPATMPPDK